MSKANNELIKNKLPASEENKSFLDRTHIDSNYLPSEDEEYMCDEQLKYFSVKLNNWRNHLINESNQTLESLKSKHMREPDDADRATAESDTNIELRTRERYLKLISKIDGALYKIENKTFGYCEETGEEIGLKRLEARPVANLTVIAQEARERKEKLMHENDAE